MLEVMKNTHAEMPRRAWVRSVIGGGLAWSGVVARQNQPQSPEDSPVRLIVRGERPLNAETPVTAFDKALTPTEHFFVRTHFRPPQVDLRPWSASVEGLVENPLALHPADTSFKDYEHVTLTAVLQCAGNGRAFFEPIVPGVPWRKGAVGNATWTGVRLRDVLTRAGLKPGAAHVHFHTAGAPPHPRTPPFLRSLPLDRATLESTLLATHMNGEPMPDIHGGPLRLIVPGWTGNHWIKWVRRIVVSDVEAPGLFQQSAYRIPRDPAPPGATVPPENLLPVTEMNVKSLIARPGAGDTLTPGPHDIVGAAWSGMVPVARVEIRIDEGPWQVASFDDPTIEPFGWRIWRRSWEATPGAHSLSVRASDAEGRIQPESTAWNKSGYLWNGIDTIHVEVRS